LIYLLGGPPRCEKTALAAARMACGGGNDAFHAKYSPSEIVDLYLRQTETFWPGLENFVGYGLRDEHDLIRIHCQPPTFQLYTRHS
jgi:DNA helicase TIP49 (TBP-interacting protein)